MWRNETSVQNAITRLTKGKTVLVIAHRMRTVAGADKVVVLEQGKVVQQGAPSKPVSYTHLTLPTIYSV